MHGELDLKVTQLIGGMGEDEWSQVRLAMPLTKAEMRSSGGLMTVVNLKGDNELISDLGAEVLDKTVERFNHEGVADIEWIKKEKENLVQSINGKGSAVMVVIKESEDGRQAAYVTGVGDTTGAWLIRKGKATQLWPSQGVLISGWLESGDLVVVATETFWNDIWIKLFGEAEERIDEAKIKAAVSNEGKVAAIIVEVGEIKRRDSPPLAVEANKETFIKNSVSLRPQNDKRRKMLLIAGAVFLILFIANVALGMVAKGKADQLKRYEAISAPIKDAITEAESIKGTNIVRARDLVADARQKIAAANQEDVVAYSVEWEKLKVEVEEKWQSVSGEKQTEINMWLDLSIIKDGLEGNKLAVSENWVEILDSDGRTVAAASGKDKSNKVVMSGDDLSGATDVGPGVVLTSKGVWQFNSEKKEKKLVIEAGEELGGAKGVRQYGGNIYSWDSTEVWKFPAAESGIGSRRRYFGVGVQPVITEMVDMWIDGEIWLMDSKAEIMRFSRGQEVNFSAKGWADEWKDTVRIFTDTAANEVMIWDKGGGVIGVFDKETGEYKRKLINEKLKIASDVVLDETNKRFVLSLEGKLMEMPSN